VLRGEQRPFRGAEQILRAFRTPRRDGHLTEAVVRDARRRQSRDRLRSPIESPPGIAWPAGMLMARPGHSRKATVRRTKEVASLFDMKALNLDDPEHGKDCERGGHR
jgi:hypothetical protein